MRNERNAFMPQMMPFQGMPQMGNMPTNMMMFPNYMNDNYTNLDNRVSALEKKVKVLDNRLSRLETPYQNQGMQNFQNAQNQGAQASQTPYQTTQNNPGNYSGEMYMM